MAKPSLEVRRGRDEFSRGGLPPRGASTRNGRDPSVNSLSKPLDLSSDMSEYARRDVKGGREREDPRFARADDRDRDRDRE
jgi:hypothetical protein